MTKTRRAPRCPICRETSVVAYAPFCSKRCADIDLGRWLSGDYAIAGRDDDDDGAEAAPRDIGRDNLAPGADGDRDEPSRH